MNRCPSVISGYSDQVEILTFHALAYRLLRAFGRYAGYGSSPLSVQSQARAKLLGHDKAQLRYEDLIPGATYVLSGSARIRTLVASRWHFVICDEVQDTSEEQWEFLQLLARNKLLLLGDGNQMIYTFVPSVSPQRFRSVQESAQRVIELEPRSHRDPSGTIPALAEAVRCRRFDDEAVREALRTGRLAIYQNVDHSEHLSLLLKEIGHAWQTGSRDVGIFAHSNRAVAELAEMLDEASVEHVLLGIPEAHAEALAAMGQECLFAADHSTSYDMRQALAVFLTAAVRSQEPPEMARALIEELPRCRAL